MEFIARVIVSIGVLIVAAIFVAVIYSSVRDDWGKKIPKFIRWILTPLFGYIGYILSAAAVRSFFTLSQEIGFIAYEEFFYGIYFWQFFAEPIFVGYAIIWSSIMIAPKFYNQVAYIIGGLFILENWLQAVQAYNYRVSKDLVGLMNAYQVGFEIQWYWTMIYSLMAIVGVVVAIFALRNKTLGFEALINKDKQVQ